MKLKLRMKLKLITLLLMLGQFAIAQRTIKGLISDAESKEPIIGAAVAVTAAIATSE